MSAWRHVGELNDFKSRLRTHLETRNLVAVWNAHAMAIRFIWAQLDNPVSVIDEEAARATRKRLAESTIDLCGEVLFKEIAEQNGLRADALIL